MSGFTNDIMNAVNVDFTGNHPVTSTVTINGQLLIGSTLAPQIKVGRLISPSGTISIGYASPNITLDATGILSSTCGIYGDGSDGAHTFDGIATILGFAPVGNVYTLTRDIFLQSSTIDGGVSINTNGFRIFCNGTLTNNGTIQSNGNSGSNDGTAGTGVINASSSINPKISPQSLGLDGANGGINVGSSADTAATYNFGGEGANGGAGASAGGAGGASLSTSNICPPRFSPYHILGFVYYPNLGSALYYTGGCGGGGGGGSGVVTGGGGGGGGGIVIIAANLFSGIGNIEAKGGNGGNGGVGGTNCGGGGGGGGGVICIASQSVSSGNIAGQTINVSGGIGGSPTGTGLVGFNGTVGLKVILLGC